MRTVQMSGATWQAFENRLEESFQTASNYSLFSGGTVSGLEGGWYGFKHTAEKTCTFIIFNRTNAYLGIRAIDGTYALKQMI